MPLLHQAVLTSDLSALERAIRGGEGVNSLAAFDEAGKEVSYTHQTKGPFFHYTPLHLAVIADDPAMVAALLKVSGILVDKASVYNCCEFETPFKIAIRRGRWFIAKQLKDAGAADPDNTYEALFANLDLQHTIKSVIANDELLAFQYLYKAIPDKSSELIRLAMVSAAYVNALKILRFMLREGVSASLTYEGCSPLGEAAQYGFYEISELLLKAGVEDIDAEFYYEKAMISCTPLAAALMHFDRIEGNPELIQLLLNNGAKVSKITSNALMHIASSGDPEELERLLQADFDPNTKLFLTHSGERFDYFIERCVKEKRFDLACVLVKYNAKCNWVDGLGRTYLHRNPSVEFAECLLRAGLNPQAKDNQGDAPADLAKGKLAEFFTQYRHDSARKILAQYPVSSGRGLSCLQQLAENCYQNGYPRKLQCLLESGLAGDINYKTRSDGWTALHFAFASGGLLRCYNSNKSLEENLEEDNMIKVITQLLCHSAKPLRNQAGCTPLMCLQQSTLNGFHMKILIDKYHEFEANYYKIDSEKYKAALNTFYKQRILGQGASRVIPLVNPRAFFAGSGGKKQAVSAFWSSLGQEFPPSRSTSPVTNTAFVL